MFAVGYAWNELRRRWSRTVVTAIGLAAGVGLVMGIVGVSDGLTQARVDGRLHTHEHTGDGHQHDRQWPAHFASSQFWPTPMSTAIGGECPHTPHISSSINRQAAWRSSGGPSNNSSS